MSKVRHDRQAHGEAGFAQEACWREGWGEDDPSADAGQHAAPSILQGACLKGFLKGLKIIPRLGHVLGAVENLDGLVKSLPTGEISTAKLCWFCFHVLVLLACGKD